ncbi:MAG: Wzz/FepE/Etk N-terminal domain-containing protein [Rhizobiaceae bacterium]
MSSNRALTADVDIDIAGLLSQVWRKKWLVLLLTLGAGAAILFALSTVSPRYKSSARIIIEKRESVFTRRSDGDYTLSGSQFDEQAIGSQVQILSSDDIALKVIEKLKLADAGEFNEEAKPSLSATILGSLGMRAPTLDLTPDERLLKTFRERLTVYAVEKSRVIVVEFWAKDPDLSHTVPNALVDEYLEFARQNKLESNEEATQWLGPEIDELRNKVREAERKVADFRSNSDILIGNNNALLATQQLSEVSSELSRLRADRSAAEAKIATVRAVLEKGASVDVIPEVIASPLIQRLRERQVQLRAEISELSTTLLPNHPRLKALQSQVNDFDAQIRLETRNILKSLETNVDLTRQQEGALVSDLNRLKVEAARVGEAEVGLRALEREANAQRELLETYLTRYREAASRQTRDYLPIDARIISRATKPSESYFPKVIPFTVAGMLATMLLTIVGILAWALMTGKAFRPIAGPIGEMMPEPVHIEPVQRPVSAVPAQNRGEQHDLPRTHAPAMFDDSDMVGSGVPVSPAARAANDPDTFGFADAAAAIADLGSARVALVSPGGDAGSRLCWKLARYLANGGYQVAVMDLTGTGVTGNEFLGNPRLAGVKEFLSGVARFKDVVHVDRNSSAHIVPSGVQETPGFDISRLEAISDAMATNYDFVLFDCGLAGPEGVTVVARQDAIILVSCEGASREDAAGSADRFSNAGYGDTIKVRLEPAGKGARVAA